MRTSETLQLLLNKIPAAECEAHRTPGIMKNLLSALVLMDAGCEVFFYGTGIDVTFSGEVILRWWCGFPTKLWSVSLIHDGGYNIVPSDTNIIDESSISRCFFNRNFECDTKSQLITLYHATMGHPVISNWCKAIKDG